MKVKIHSYYGVLGHEKTPVYKEHEINETISDALYVDVPNVVGANEAGDTLVEINGSIYVLNELLCTTQTGKPAIQWHDGCNIRIQSLEVVG